MKPTTYRKRGFYVQLIEKTGRYSGELLQVKWRIEGRCMVNSTKVEWELENDKFYTGVRVIFWDGAGWHTWARIRLSCVIAGNSAGRGGIYGVFFPGSLKMEAIAAEEGWQSWQ